MLMISVSENFLVESKCFILLNKIRSILAQGFCIYVGILFYETQLDQLPFVCLSTLTDL